MKKNKTLDEVVANLPKNSKITYTQQPTPKINVPYMLTVEGYSKFYLNTSPLPDLTQEEQIILLASKNSDPIRTPDRTIAAIFKARQISERSQNQQDAVNKCNSVLVDENKDWLEARNKIYDDVTQKKTHARQLEYYLENERKFAQYKKQQSSIFAVFINMKNRVSAFLRRKPYSKQPVSEEELFEGQKVWEAFRAEQHAPETMSNKALLTRYKFNSDVPHGQPFEFMFQSPELAGLLENYMTTNMALQILDGSAYKRAEATISKNTFQYLKQLKSENTAHQNR